MLTHLSVKNYALIDHLEMEFYQGLSTITGETGAGKSILLGALGLIQGQRADSSVIKAGESHCVVEASFDVSTYGMASFFEENELDYQKITIVRRQLSANGKSRAFINDLPVNLTILRDFTARVLDIHSQHANLLLQDAPFQMEVVDTYGGALGILEEYKDLYRRWREAVQALSKRKEELAKSQEEQDYLLFQFEELRAAQLEEGEQEQLEARQKMLEHAEELAAAYWGGYNLLRGEQEGNIIASLHTAFAPLQRLQEADPRAGEAAKRIESALLELEDVARDLEVLAEGTEYNPQEAERVAERLSLIYSLQTKHRLDSAEELLTLQASLKEQIDSISTGAADVIALEKTVKKARESLQAVGEKLSAARKGCVEALSREVAQTLILLGIPHAAFEINLPPFKDYEPTGAEGVEFLFSANRNLPLQPLSKVASGGEMSRVMLTLKRLIAIGAQLPTIIFDEIDTGISGEIASKMGSIMEQMAEHMQVINITHLPQIAARGEHHYLVYKEHEAEQSSTRIRLLNDKERKLEIAKMLSGAEVTAAALANAQELLKGERN